MSARTVLDTARTTGFRVESRGDKLHVEPTPPPDLIEQLRQRKAEIIELLASTTQAAEPGAWVDRCDVVTVVEDLASEGWRLGRISRTLGLTRNEVLTILRRTGR
jgi:hypothetical protein